MKRAVLLNSLVDKARPWLEGLLGGTCDTRPRGRERAMVIGTRRYFDHGHIPPRGAHCFAWRGKIGGRDLLQAAWLPLSHHDLLLCCFNQNSMPCSSLKTDENNKGLLPLHVLYLHRPQ